MAEVTAFYGNCLQVYKFYGSTYAEMRTKIFILFFIRMH